MHFNGTFYKIKTNIINICAVNAFKFNKFECYLQFKCNKQIMNNIKFH